MSIIKVLGMIVVLAASVPAFSLSESDQASLQQLLRARAQKAQAERAYIKKVQPQILRDMIELYASKQTQLTYASFPGEEPGEDGGFGFHVVKRFELGSKVVLVNEHWPFRDGRIHLPDEIRVRSRAFGLEAGKPATADDFIVARFRIGWDAEDRPLIYDDAMYDEQDRVIKKRSQISVLSCNSCHNPAVATAFAGKFAKPGESIDPATIVQAQQFDQGLENSPGFQEFMTSVAGSLPGHHVSAMRKALLQEGPRRMELPGIMAALQHKLKHQSYSWIGGDEPVSGRSHLDRGIYQKGGEFWRDALESLLEISSGKWHWWFENQKVLPTRSEVP